MSCHRLLVFVVTTIWCVPRLAVVYTPLSLTFLGPCIANIFAEYNQQDATFSIYFCKTLYMFQTIFPSIIRSSKLHIQRQVFVRPLLQPAVTVLLPVYADWKMTMTFGRANYEHSSCGALRSYYI